MSRHSVEQLVIELGVHASCAAPSSRRSPASSAVRSRKPFSRTESGVSSNTKNSNSKPAYDLEAHVARLARAPGAAVPRGQTASASSANSPRKNSMSSSNGIGAAGVGQDAHRRVRDSRCASRCTSRCRRAGRSSPSPAPRRRSRSPCRAREKNLSRDMYLPRRMPSMSKTPTLTWSSLRSSTILRASAAVRMFSGFNGMMSSPWIVGPLRRGNVPWPSRACQTGRGAKGRGAEAPLPVSI